MIPQSQPHQCPEVTGQSGRLVGAVDREPDCARGRVGGARLGPNADMAVGPRRQSPVASETGGKRLGPAGGPGTSRLSHPSHPAEHVPLADEETGPGSPRGPGPRAEGQLLTTPDHVLRQDRTSLGAALGGSYSREQPGCGTGRSRSSELWAAGTSRRPAGGGALQTPAPAPSPHRRPRWWTSSLTRAQVTGARGEAAGR